MRVGYCVNPISFKIAHDGFNGGSRGRVLIPSLALVMEVHFID